MAALILLSQDPDGRSIVVLLAPVKALLDLLQIIQQAARRAFYVLTCFADYLIVAPQCSEHKETSL